MQAQAETHAQSHAETLRAEPSTARQARGRNGRDAGAGTRKRLPATTSELEAARQETHALRDTLSRERDTHNQSLAQVHAETRAQVEAQSQVHKQAQEQLQALLTQAQGRASEAETLRSERESLRAEVTGRRDQLGAAKSANELMQSSTAQQTQQSNAQASELQIVRDELSSARAMLAAQREAHDQLQGSLVRKDAQVADLEQRARTRHRVGTGASRGGGTVAGIVGTGDEGFPGGERGFAPRTGADGAKRGAERVGRLAAAMAVDLNGAAKRRRRLRARCSR